MIKNHVESFVCSDSIEMEDKINLFCKNRHYNPVSISVIWSAGTYVAFVVVEELDGDSP